MILSTNTLRIIWAVATLGVSVVGGLLALAVGLPAAFLCGGALAVSLAALLGLKATILTPIRDVAFVIIGVSMGAAVDKDTLSLIGQWPVSISALMIGLAVIISLTTLALHRVFHIDRMTSFLSSSPGHLSFIIGISETGHGNTRQIVVIQSIRVLILTIAVPIGAQILTGGNLELPVRAPDMPLITFVILTAACALGGFVMKTLGIPAGYVLGAMLVATIAKLAGLFSGSVPLPLVTFSFVLMGALIGSRFVGVSSNELRQSALGGIVVAFLAIGIVTIAAFLVTQLVDIPFGQIWIALSPGGLETMGALGVAFGYDPAFIAAHHALRLLVLGLSIPMITLMLMSKKKAH